MKELFQVIMAAIYLRQGKALPGALPAGKVSTAVLFVSLIFLVMLPDMPDRMVQILALVNGCFLNVSLVCYLFAYWGRNKQVQDFQP